MRLFCDAIELHSPSTHLSGVPFTPSRTRAAGRCRYSNAPYIELLVNGKSQGSKTVVPMIQGPGSYAEWTAVPWEAGKLTAVAHDAKGSPLASMDRYTNGKPAQLQLSIDAPSKATGTGEALLLDGHDAALIRAAVVDGSGRVMHLATNNISFAVISGPGFVQGTGNGDPHCHEPNDAPWHTAYHGLVRAVVRVSSTAARSTYERALLARIDHDGLMSVSAGRQYPMALSDSDIVVEATSPGFAPARLTIPTSTDAATAGVLEVARAAAGQPVNFFG